MDPPADFAPGPANLEATPILDIRHEDVTKVVRLLASVEPPNRSWLQKAHTFLVDTLRPVYSINEWQPVSLTIRKACGSCSQRMACLEAVGRAVGIPSRVRALRVKGSFWYPRFRYLRPFIPKTILLLWPQFFVEGKWVDFDELYSPLVRLAETAQHGFANDAESLFEAVRDTPVDWLGRTCGLACAKSEYNLSQFVVTDEGFFDTRDEALGQLGSFQHTLRGRLFEIILGDARSRR